MVYISKKYFIDTIENLDDNSYVHIDPSIGEYNKFPSCYHIGKGKRFVEVLDLPDDWEMSLWRVQSSNLGKDPGGELSGKKEWFADEQYATNKILNKNNKNTKKNIKKKNTSTKNISDLLPNTFNHKFIFKMFPIHKIDDNISY